MKRRIVSISFLLLAVLGGGVAHSQDTSSEGPSLAVYPSYLLKFNGSHNYLLAALSVVNVSGHEMTNVTVTQSFPGDFVPAPAPDGIHDYFVRVAGFEEKIEGQGYRMFVPTLHRRELTTGFIVLSYHGRPTQASIPPAEVNYSSGGEPHKEFGPPQKLDLTKYSKYSGSLNEFLKRFAAIQIRIPETGATDWGFSALASRMKAKNPLGVIEIDGDAAKGRFSLQSGGPGEMQELMISWKPLSEAKPASTPEEVKKLLEDQVVAAADFTFDAAAVAAEKQSFARGDAWALSTRWKDRVAARLGEGPMKWYVYPDSQKGTQYIILLRAQGRGAGPGKAEIANPEKEASLIGQLEEIVKSFRPI